MPDPIEPAVPVPPADRTRDVADPINPTIADQLSPLARARTYAALATVVPASQLAVELFDPPDWVSKVVVLAGAVVTFAGFGLARSNTPVTRRQEA